MPTCGLLNRFQRFGINLTPARLLATADPESLDAESLKVI